MAALRKFPRHILGQLSHQTSFIPSLQSPPSLFISRRGIAYKLFVKELPVSRIQENDNSAAKDRWSSTDPVSTFDTAKGLSFYTTERGLLEAFSPYGQVVEAKVVMDRVSDRSKGFGFVTFASEDEAEKAKMEMDGKALNGRVLFVDYAKPQRY